MYEDPTTMAIFGGITFVGVLYAIWLARSN